jgi:multiple sugar transport system substrate-binding protein
MLRRSSKAALRGRWEGWRPGAGRIGLIAAVLACAATIAGLGAGIAGASSKAPLVTLSEIDYYNSPPDVTALPPILNACARENGAKIERQVVPQADLVPKLLQDVSAHSFPDLALIDNPNVQQFAATGALAPLTGSTKGLFPSIVSAGTYKGKSYGFAPGVNTIALYYNKAMLAAAGLKPPTTWAELKSDASALTHGSVYGYAYSAPNEEEASWSFEPFLWENGGELKKLNSSKAVSALTYYDSLVTDGSVSKSALTWTQADVEEQFAAGDAAMMTNGPWQLPTLATSAVKNGFGIVPMPVPTAGGHPITPLGGEMWTVGRVGGIKQKKAEAVVNCLVSKKESVAWSNTDGYLSSNEAGAKKQAAKDPLLKAFESEISTARARTGPPAYLGTNYNAVSQALWTAIQSTLDGSKTPSQALGAAQSSVPHGA